MGMIGGTLRAFQGDPTFSTLDNVKSQPIQNEINSSLDSYKKLLPLGDASLKSYLGAYSAYNPTAAANTVQEQDAIGGYYNGTVARALAGLAAQRQKSVLDAAGIAQQNALKSSNLSLLNGGGGNNSYNTRLLANNMAGISASAALDNANQLSQNYQQVLGGQIGMAGRRTALADALAQRQMQPYSATAGLFGQNQGYLNNILSMNNANNIFGVQQNKTDLDQWAQFADVADQGIMSAASIAGSVMGGGMGGMGGGGGKGFTPQNTNADGTANWSQGGGNNYSPVSSMWGGALNMGIPSGGSYYAPQSYSGDGPSTMGWGAPAASPATLNPDVGWGGGGGGMYS